MTTNSMTNRASALPVAAALFAALVLVQAAPAAAQTEDGREESPQRFAFELRFGPYLPEVDDSVGTVCSGQGPYEAVFGDDSRLMTELEFDFQPLNIVVGTLAVGAALGIFHASAKAFEQGSCTTRSSDETDLWALPLSLLAVVRFDIFAERWNIPLVPFIKFGFTYAIWWATDENGVSNANGDSGYGGTFGLRLGGGLMLRLDWIDRRTARTFDNEFGVNHTYIFFEYYWAWLDGFGSDEAMNLSDNTFAAGLALEF